MGSGHNASEAIARREAEASGKDASEQRAIAVGALDEARNTLDLADCLLDAMQITLQHSQLLQLSLNFPAADEPEFKEAMTENQVVAERLAYGVDEARKAIMSGIKSRGE